MRNLNRSVRGVVLLLVIAFAIFFIRSFLSRNENSGLYCWVMATAPPKGTVPVWIPIHGEYQKSCKGLKKMSPFSELVTVLESTIRGSPISHKSDR